MVRINLRRHHRINCKLIAPFEMLCGHWTLKETMDISKYTNLLEWGRGEEVVDISKYTNLVEWDPIRGRNFITALVAPALALAPS